MMKYPDESLCIGKDGTMNENGDHIFNSQHFKAVFDGATPKGKQLWEGVPGDVYASRVLCEAMRNVEPSVSPSSLISRRKAPSQCYYLQCTSERSVVLR